MRRRAKPCGRCDKAVAKEENGLKCHWCKEWFHAACEGVPQDLRRALADLPDQNVWLCKGCQGEVKTSATKIGELERLNQELREHIKELEGKREEGECMEVN